MRWFEAWNLGFLIFALGEQAKRGENASVMYEKNYYLL